MIKLNEALKFAEEQTKRNAAAKAARGAGLPTDNSSQRGSISPELAKRLAMSSSPLLTKGLESLLREGNSEGFDEMISLDGMLGMAAQFLPPWAGDALAVGSALASGDVAGALDAMLSKYLPPEVKAVYDAIKNLPGGWPEFLKWLMENPKEPQGAAGLWAARISDMVVCPGGVGAIVTGMPTVIIGGFPAARVDDVALCNGIPSDKITHGESTVHIGGKWASRITDQTIHGGKIAAGFQTVHISRSLGQCGGCLSSAASGGAGAGSAGAGAGAGGAATISGSGMTGPLTENAFGGLGDIFKDALAASQIGDLAINKLADYAAGKALDALGDLIGAEKDETADGSNFQSFDSNQSVEKDKPKVIPKAQPNVFDSED